MRDLGYEGEHLTNEYTVASYIRLAKRGDAPSTSGDVVFRRVKDCS